MIGPAPKKPWDKYIESTNKKYGPFDGYPGLSVRLKPGASDEIKRKFEAYMTADVKRYKQSIVPDMKDPYFTWQGDIVEKSSLKR